MSRSEVDNDDSDDNSSDDDDNSDDVDSDDDDSDDDDDIRSSNGTNEKSELLMAKRHDHILANYFLHNQQHTNPGKPLIVLVDCTLCTLEPHF